MILIVCLDDKNGMAFNKRRQSKDSVLRSRILELTANTRLYMNNYSFKQFEEENSIIVDEDFLSKAGAGDFCFIEDRKASCCEKDIEKIIAYRWNRVYPADLRFDICLDAGWRKTSSLSFKGSSHEKITEEVFER